MSQEDKDVAALDAVSERNSMFDTEGDDAAPDINSPEWTNYVFSLLTPGVELFDSDDGKFKMPNGHGLRRIFPELMGTVLFNGVHAYTPPTIHHNTKIKNETRQIMNPAVCTWRISYHDKRDNTIKDIIEIGSVYVDNCDAPYVFHASETAASKAESRALRKALRLQCNTREEISGGAEYQEPSDDRVVNSGELALLDKMCKRKNVEGKTLFNDYAPHYSKRYKELPHSLWQLMIDDLKGRPNV